MDDRHYEAAESCISLSGTKSMLYPTSEIILHSSIVTGIKSAEQNEETEAG